MNLLITPAILKQRSQKIWMKGELHQAHLQGNSCFPLYIPLKNIPAKSLLAHFSEIQQAIDLLRLDSSKQGYIITDKVINHRQLGDQCIPEAICFETEDILLKYLAKSAEFESFKHLTKQTLNQQPVLLEWLIRYPFKLLKYADVWLQLLNVCCYFKNNPKPNCYIRQLDIKGVDSKFIEKHKGILNELLTEILMEADYDENVTGLNNQGFERRYGLLYDQPLIRLRVLDTNLAIQGLMDLTLTVKEFKKFNIAVETVFIAENKVNGLAFPNYPKAIVIFGLGYAVNLLADAESLKKRALYYWGDIDTHGFAILSRLRHYYPQVQSLLMNKQTLEKFSALTGNESLEKSEQNPVSLLTEEENLLYQQIQKSLLRLEQERIGFSYLQETLSRLEVRL